MDVQNRLKEIKERREDIREKIKDLERQIRELNELEGEILFGVKVGDVVDYEGKKYKITRIESWYLAGSPTNKDGSLSKKEVHLYNFKRVF